MNYVINIILLPGRYLPVLFQKGAVRIDIVISHLFSFFASNQHVLDMPSRSVSKHTFCRLAHWGFVDYDSNYYNVQHFWKISKWEWRYISSTYYYYYCCCCYYYYYYYYYASINSTEVNWIDILNSVSIAVVIACDSRSVFYRHVMVWTHCTVHVYTCMSYCRWVAGVIERL